MAKVSQFEDLEIWQMGREIANEIWSLIESSPLKTDFPLRNQINRSSGSIMDNIAEGFERDGNKEFSHFLSIAKASCGETRSQLCRCLDRKHIDKDTFDKLRIKTITTSSKIKALMIYLKNSERKGSKFD
ncbi:four helix bundle protein [Flavimarina sp. Hel_I_48]|uniref:four helix bundle protein n=1 Tax=Flavimarina sp. Hel_I_48 TaxID=1392488 RepID=UPI0004DF5939|nr:four helix bundle protein [Flavimarina sp. Hel_I_48]